MILTYSDRRIKFYPERPALTTVCRQLSNEALGIYYAESIFYFADTMLVPEIMLAFKALRGDLLDHIRTTKVHHRPQLRFDPPAWTDDIYCSVRFAAHLVNKTDVVLEDPEITAIDRHYNVKLGLDSHFGVRFLGDVMDRTDRSYAAPALINFLITYIEGLRGVHVYEDATCEACGRKKTIRLRGACCGYRGGWP